MPRTLDCLYRRDHRPLNGPQGGTAERAPRMGDAPEGHLDQPSGGDAGWPNCNLGFTINLFLFQRQKDAND